MNSVTMKWAQENIDSINLIDVRSTAEFADRSVKGAVNIPLAGIVMNADSLLDRNKTYHVMCLSGGRSFNACIELESQGFDVVNCEGGISSI